MRVVSKFDDGQLVSSSRNEEIAVVEAVAPPYRSVALAKSLTFDPLIWLADNLLGFAQSVPIFSPKEPASLPPHR